MAKGVSRVCSDAATFTISKIAQRVTAAPEEQLNLGDATAVLAEVRQLAIHVALDDVRGRDARADQDHREPRNGERDLGTAAHQLVRPAITSPATADGPKAPAA